MDVRCWRCWGWWVLWRSTTVCHMDLRLPWKNHHVDGILVGKTLAFSYANVCVPEGVWDILFKIVLTIIRYFHPKIHTSNKHVFAPIQNLAPENPWTIFQSQQKTHSYSLSQKEKQPKTKLRQKPFVSQKVFLENNLYTYIYIYISTYKYHLNCWTNKISPTSAIIIYTQPFNQRLWWLPLKNGLNYLKGSCLQVEIWELMVVGCFQLGGLVGSSWLVGWLVGWLVRCDNKGGKISGNRQKVTYDLYWS